MTPLFYSICVVGMNDEVFRVEHLNGAFLSLDEAQEAAFKLLPPEVEPASIKVNVFSADMLRKIANTMEGVDP